MSHYLPYYCEYNGRKLKAVCGEWIAMGEFSKEPTCEQCQLWIVAERETENETAEERFGVADQSTVVPIIPFDCTGGRPRR